MAERGISLFIFDVQNPAEDGTLENLAATAGAV
jgi:hypothetical protein